MPNVREVIDELIAQGRVIATREVAGRAGVSRQAAHKQLAALVRDGVLTVEGKARAARYHAKTADVADGLWAKVQALGDALRGIDNSPQLTFHAQARLPRAQVAQVASAGSLFRLSARLLLAEVDCEDLTLDFTGVVDLGEEFVEEVFEVWARAHPLTKVKIVNLDPKLLRRLPVTATDR